MAKRGGGFRLPHDTNGEDAYPTLWLKAAALIQSIDDNLALQDGNKRLAWSATTVFLRLNGWRLRADAGEGVVTAHPMTPIT